MLTRAQSRDSGMKLQTVNRQWQAKKVQQYLQQIDRFLELLLFGVHVTSGQPG
jgi:hypothetical protein